MTQPSSAEARTAAGRKVDPRAPQLPRVEVGTRMPAAPAPAGRIITVGPPSPGARKGGLDGGIVFVGLMAAVALTLVWRALHRRGLQQ